MISAVPGRLNKIIVVNRGINGVFKLHDCNSIELAAAANAIFMLSSGALAGTVVDLDWPCLVGITLSAVPGGMPVLAVSYT